MNTKYYPKKYCSKCNKAIDTSDRHESWFTVSRRDYIDATGAWIPSKRLYYCIPCGIKKGLSPEPEEEKL